MAPTCQSERRSPAPAAPGLELILVTDPAEIRLFTAAGWTRLGQQGRKAGFAWSLANDKVHEVDSANVERAKGMLRECMSVGASLFDQQDPRGQDACARALLVLAEVESNDIAACSGTLPASVL